MADGGLAAPERRQQVARTHLAGRRNEAQQPEPDGVGERGKDVGQLGGVGLAERSLEHRSAASGGVLLSPGHHRPPETY
jgi:hypothetical protein